MADEKQEEVNKNAEFAEEWDNDPDNSFEQFQINNWDKLFDGDILEGYQGSSKCKAISSIVSIEKLVSGDDKIGDYSPIVESNELYEDYSQFAGQIDVPRFVRTAYDTSPADEAKRDDGGLIFGGEYDGKKRTCKAIADIAYERYRAGELFDELVLEPLSEAVQVQGGAAIQCAKSLQENAVKLSKLLEKFKEESYSETDGIYKDVDSATRMLEEIATDWTPLGTTGASRWGQDPLLTKLYLINKNNIGAEYLKHSDNLASPVIMYGVSYNNKETRAEDLIIPDMIYLDSENNGQAYAANGTQITYPVGTGVRISGDEIEDFPYYWSSVVARMYTCAMAVATAASTESFSKEGIAKLESGQAKATSLDLLFKDNHGNGAFGEAEQFTAKEDRGLTLYDKLKVGSILEAPANSKIRSIISKAKQRDYITAEDLDESLDPSDGGGGEYTLSGWCTQVIEAANLIEKYPWADAEVEKGIITRFKAAATWLREAAEAIRQVADQMAKDSDCILAADEFLAEEAQSLEEEFKDQLGNNVSTIDVPFWFDKKVADLARNAAIATKDLDRDDLSKLDEILDTDPARALFKEQCLLLTYIGYFSNYKKNTLDAIDKDGNPKITTGIHKRLPYTSLLAETGIPMPIGARASATDKNASLMIDGDPYGFINKLTQSPSYGDLFDIDHWHLSSLQPKIRLFKVVYENDDEGNPIEKETEISFESHFSKRELDLFKNRRSRGAGVGLKSFEFTYDGSNPFAAKKSIKANLKIFASTFSELFEDRDGTNNTKYKYVDLALKTFTKEKNPDEYDSWKAIVDENEKLAKLNFRLKALVGWTSPPGRIPDDLHSNYSNAGLKAALADSFVTLNLTPTVHNFEFDEQGRVIMNINYLAYVEDFFDQTAFNVYADPTPGFQNIGFIREKRKLQMKALRSKCDYDDAGADDTTLEDLEKEYAESVDKEISESIQKIIGTLMEDDKVYFVNVDMTEVSKHTTLGPYVDIGSILIDPAGAKGVLGGPLDRSIKKALEKMDDLEGQDGKIAAALAASNPYHYNLGFFYISDLIDTVLGNIESELTVVSEQFKNLNELEYVEDIELKRRKANLLKFKQNFKRLRILLGPVEFIEYKRTSGKRKNSSFVNFGDIPVSVKYFVEFLADRSLSREDSFYSLTSFLNDLFNNLITNFLNNKKCFAFSAAQRVRVNQSTITSFNDTDKPDEITSLILEKANNIKGKRSGNPARLSLNDTVTKEHLKQGRPILNISGRGTTRKYIPIDKETNYFTFFAGRVQPVERMNGDKAEDHQNGIFHYLLGRDRGLVKNISLSKTETPGLQEVRFEQEGYEGLEQLRVVYDADIECYSNVNTFPGTYIYIDPKGFDPSLTENFDITKYGVGGYYMIIKSTHKFAAGEAKSKIYAKWVAQLQTSYPVESAGSIGSNTETGSARGCKEAKERLSTLQNSDEG